MLGILQAPVQRSNCVELAFESISFRTMLSIDGVYVLAACDDALS